MCMKSNLVGKGVGLALNVLRTGNFRTKDKQPEVCRRILRGEQHGRSHVNYKLD